MKVVYKVRGKGQVTALQQQRSLNEKINLFKSQL